MNLLLFKVYHTKLKWTEIDSMKDACKSFSTLQYQKDICMSTMCLHVKVHKKLAWHSVRSTYTICIRKIYFSNFHLEREL